MVDYTHPPNGCFCRLMEQMQPAPLAEIFYRQWRSDSRARCAPRETGMGKQGTCLHLRRVAHFAVGTQTKFENS